MKTFLCGLFLMLMSLPAQAIEPGSFKVVGDTLSPEQAQTYDARMAQSLDQLKPQRQGVTDTYIVSIALWNDPVFVSEALQAANILSQRYDGEGRTLILTSGVGKDLPDGLLAGPDMIAAALKGVGQRIDPDEDLVIVFITSHGVDTGELGLLRVEEQTVGAMTPLWLKTQLDAAGIPVRFVIISACYSGHFVPPFDDINSAVFTAASDARSSFGCSPERDWTFFGDALFNHLLRGGVDFETAQASATRLIHVWEMREGVEPSLPQRHVGKKAGMRIHEAEGFGRAIGCTADLWHVSNRSDLSLQDRPAVLKAMARHRDRAHYMGKSRGYSRLEVDTKMDAAHNLPAYRSGFDTVQQRVQACLND